MDPRISDVERPGEQSGPLYERVRILEAVLENMADGVVVVDEHGRFLLFNGMARRICGRGPVDEAIERWSEIYGIFRPDGVTRWPAQELPLTRTLRGDSTDHIEMVFRNAAHPDGIMVAATGRPLRDRDGKVRGGIVVLRDITQQKRAELALRESHDRLSELLEEQERYANRSALLAEMSSLLQATTSVDELYAVVAEYLERLFPGAHGAFFAYSASRDDLEPKACWGGFAGVDESALIKPTECWGLRRGRVHGVHGHTRMRCGHVPASLDRYLCMPVLGPHETLGLLHVRFDAPADPAANHEEALWAERERVITTAAEYLGLALVNIRLRLALQQQSIRDPLTGLFNRRFLEETLAQEIRRAQRKPSTVCVVMLDIDRFKLFNDTYGHAAGDIVLREFSALLREGIRGGDIASRYGGEEFTLVLPDTALSDAHNRTAQLLERISTLGVSFNGNALGTISASAGIAAYPDHGEDAETLLRAADTALYAAKQAGRNRVVIFVRPQPIRV